MLSMKDDHAQHAARMVYVAIAYMLFGGLCFALMSNTIRFLSESYDAPQIVFARNLFSLVIILPWVMVAGMDALRTTRFTLLAVRAAFLFASMSLWFFSISVIPLPEAVSLTYTTPLFLTIAAIVFLRERPHRRRLIAIVLGFTGVMVVIQPGYGELGWEGMFPLLASLTAAVGIFLVKPLSQTESPYVQLFYMTVLMIPFSAPLGILSWHWPTMEGWGALFLVGLFSTGVQYALIKSYGMAEMTLLLPFDFVRLVFTSAIAYYAFGDQVDIWLVCGAGLILGSTLYITHRESRDARHGVQRGSKREKEGEA